MQAPGGSESLADLQCSPTTPSSSKEDHRERGRPVDSAEWVSPYMIGSPPSSVSRWATTLGPAVRGSADRPGPRFADGGTHQEPRRYEFDIPLQLQGDTGSACLADASRKFTAFAVTLPSARLDNPRRKRRRRRRTQHRAIQRLHRRATRLTPPHTGRDPSPASATGAHSLAG